MLFMFINDLIMFHTHMYTYIGYPQGYGSPDKARVVSFYNNALN